MDTYQVSKIITVDEKGEPISEPIITKITEDKITTEDKINIFLHVDIRTSRYPASCFLTRQDILIFFRNNKPIQIIEPNNTKITLLQTGHYMLDDMKQSELKPNTPHIGMFIIPTKGSKAPVLTQDGKSFIKVTNNKGKILNFLNKELIKIVK
jgi:hypothetical protein